MAEGVFTLDLNETFPRLAHAPIVEAVIHWQARAQKPMEQDVLKKALVARLPTYPQSAPIQGFGLTATLSPADDATRVEHQRVGFLGLRLTSADGCYIVQFLRDGLVFSRTKPYEHWEPFAAAARQAWHVFMDIAEPVEIQRLGVRFINHIGTAMPETLASYLRDPPTCPSNLPLKEFVYQSIFAVPGHPFGIRVIKVMQPTMPELQQSSGLFLDIDVFSTTAIQNESAAMDEALAKMRWLKNKVFFTLLTDGALQSFSRGAP
jgi:uncharacterized protein (TIGR04255 family)